MVLSIEQMFKLVTNIGGRVLSWQERHVKIDLTLAHLLNSIQNIDLCYNVSLGLEAIYDRGAA